MRNRGIGISGFRPRQVNRKGFFCHVGDDFQEKKAILTQLPENQSRFEKEKEALNQYTKNVFDAYDFVRVFFVHFHEISWRQK